MKKLFIFALTALMVAACGNQKKEKDDENAQGVGTENISQADADARDRELDELLAIYNDVTEAMQQINDAQGRVVIAQQGERANRRELIQEDMKFIQEKLAENAELIKKLREQLENTDIKSKQLKRTIDDLMSQLQSKTQEIQKLREELEAKDIHIAELDRQLESLNENIDQLNENFNANSYVNAKILRQKGLIPESATEVKITAFGKIDKPLMVQASCFAPGVAKMIILAGGRPIQVQ